MLCQIRACQCLIKRSRISFQLVSETSIKISDASASLLPALLSSRIGIGSLIPAIKIGFCAAIRLLCIHMPWQPKSCQTQNSQQKPCQPFGFKVSHHLHTSHPTRFSSCPSIPTYPVYPSRYGLRIPSFLPGYRHPQPLPHIHSR